MRPAGCGRASGLNMHFGDGAVGSAVSPTIVCHRRRARSKRRSAPRKRSRVTVPANGVDAGRRRPPARTRSGRTSTVTASAGAHAMRRRRRSRPIGVSTLSGPGDHARPRLAWPTKAATFASPAVRRARAASRSGRCGRSRMHDDAVGHRQRFLLVVRDMDGGDAVVLLDAADLVAHLDAQSPRRARTAARRAAAPAARRPARGPAPRAAAGRRRARAGLRSAKAVEPDRAERRHAPRSRRLPRGRPRTLQRIGDVLPRRHVREQRVGLEDDAEVAPRAAARRHVLPADQRCGRGRASGSRRRASAASTCRSRWRRSPRPARRRRSKGRCRTRLPGCPDRRSSRLRWR